MPLGFSIDPDQGLSEADELQLVRLAAELGYDSAWTPSRADAAAFDRCLRWHLASGIGVIVLANGTYAPAPALASRLLLALLTPRPGAAGCAGWSQTPYNPQQFCDSVGGTLTSDGRCLAGNN